MTFYGHLGGPGCPQVRSRAALDLSNFPIVSLCKVVKRCQDAWIQSAWTQYDLDWWKMANLNFFRAQNLKLMLRNVSHRNIGYSNCILDIRLDIEK